MGKHSRTEPVDDLFEDNHPSCMWGILHALDYHHWQYNVRKMLPHKKHYRSRHAKVGNGRQKVRLNVPDSDEDQELLGAEMDPSTTETSATNKRSLKARIKALISQEPSDTPPRGKSNGWSHRFIFLYRHAVSDHMKCSKKTVTCDEKFNVGGAENVFEYLEHKRPSENHTLCPEKCVKAKENLVNQKHVEGKEHCVDASCQCKEYADVLEIFNLNKDTGDGLVNCFHNLQASNARTRLIKSGSFPAADFLHSRKFRPSKLKHKQNEVWSFPKGEKLFAPKLSNDMSELLMVNDTGGEVLNQDLYFSSMDSTQGSDKQENSKVIIDRVEDDNSSIFHEIDGSAYNLNKVKPIRVRRTSSLSGSLERYAQLLQNSSSREAKLQVSKSLKLSNEYEIPSGGHAPTSFKRFQSLPHLDSYGSLQNELSCDAHVSRIETWTVVDSCKNFESESHDEPKPVNIPVSTEKYVPLEANRETEFVCNIVERSDSSLKNEHVASATESTNENSISEMLGLGEEMEEQTLKDSNLEKEKEVTLREIASNRLPQPRPVSVLPSCSQEDVIGPNDFPASQDLDCRFSDVDETESSVDFQYRSSSNALTWSCSIANPESFRIANKSAKNHRQDNADFDYVSDILERSGFDRTGFLGPWHSLDQPLNPLVFAEAEACWSHEPQRYGDEHFASCHQLLFDLINEVMVQIYDTSFTYYPKALSVNCRIPPIPLKYNVIDDAWERISRTLSSRQGLDQSMDYVGVQDLGKDDGWMNLQLETECVGLELEDIIFNELLEEILRS